MRFKLSGVYFYSATILITNKKKKKRISDTSNKIMHALVNNYRINDIGVLAILISGPRSEKRVYIYLLASMLVSSKRIFSAEVEL